MSMLKKKLHIVGILILILALAIFLVYLFWEKPENSFAITRANNQRWCVAITKKLIIPKPNKPKTYRCMAMDYSDGEKACKNSNECEGNCLVVSPKINYYDLFNDPVFKEFNCQGIGEYEVAQTNSGIKHIYKKYFCEKGSFIARCSNFSWDKANQWEVNDNVINYLYQIYI